jgi:ankyrin repeat protein
MAALLHRSLDCMKLLIEAGFLFHFLFKFNYSLAVISKSNNLSSVSFFNTFSPNHSLQAGADVNGKGSIVSPLLIATQQGGYTDFIRFLLEAGADPNICDDVCFVHFLDALLILVPRVLSIF